MHILPRHNTYSLSMAVHQPSSVPAEKRPLGRPAVLAVQLDPYFHKA